MAENAEAGTFTAVPADDSEYFYAVLNLPKSASDHEVRERYRQLSIVFHPDKQVDEGRKATATHHFLELQKAYEVLSDPVTRRAYDLLGPEGLHILQSADFKHVAEEAFEDELRRRQRELDRLRVEQAVYPRGSVSIGVDASSIFDDQYEDEDGEPVSAWRNLQLALGEVRRNRFAVSHRIRAKANKKTRLTLFSRVAFGTNPRKRQGGFVGHDFMGTVSHQFSPRLNVQATTSLLNVSGISMKSVYRTDDYVVAFQSDVHPIMLLQPFTYRWGQPLLLPPLSVSIFRRLFPNLPMQGSLEASITPSGPTISIGVTSSALHDASLDRAAEDDLPNDEVTLRAPSSSGLAIYSSDWQIGVDLAGAASGLRARYGLSLLELGVHLQAAVRLGLAGLTWLVGGEWRGDNGSISTSVNVNVDGVVLRVDASYHRQTLSLPIILSREHNGGLGFWTAVLPSTALALIYYFQLRPRRRRERLEYLKEARRQLREEKSEVLRRWQETLYLLQDTASRHLRTEEACDGLIILDARYGPAERDEGTEGLDVDVTVPMQALVNSSQLSIPGKRSKAGIPGFYDPVAGVPKALRVRYKFRGRMHYAEIPDYSPVVIPLKDHLVE
ncbi:DnaJ-domain-containing protein [Daedaleopsis nitida]|nr:DnaJ-domain-containing protein [Daedaleopsis nitida]